jgi:hypothetical protein
VDWTERKRKNYVCQACREKFPATKQAETCCAACRQWLWRFEQRYGRKPMPVLFPGERYHRSTHRKASSHG